MAFVWVNAYAVGGLIHLPYTGPVKVPDNGHIQVDIRDLAVLTAIGCITAPGLVVHSDDPRLPQLQHTKP